MQSRIRQQNKRLCFLGILTVSFFAGIQQDSMVRAEEGQVPFPRLELQSFPDTTRQKAKAALPEIQPQSDKKPAKLPELPVIKSPSTSKLVPNTSTANNQTVKNQTAPQEPMPSDLIVPALEESLLGNKKADTTRTSSIWNRNEFIVKPTNPVPVAKERKIRSRELSASEPDKAHMHLATVNKPDSAIAAQNGSSFTPSLPSSQVSPETPVTNAEKPAPREVLVYSPRMLFAIDLVPENQAPYHVGARTIPNTTSISNPIVNTKPDHKQMIPANEKAFVSPLPGLSDILHHSEEQPKPNIQQENNVRSTVQVPQRTSVQPQAETSEIASIAMEFIPQGSGTTAVVLREESSANTDADSPQMINEPETDTKPHSLPPIVLNPNVPPKRADKVQLSSKHQTTENSWFDSLPQDDFLIGFDDSVGCARSSDIQEVPAAPEKIELTADKSTENSMPEHTKSKDLKQVAFVSLPAIAPGEEEIEEYVQKPSIQEPKPVQKFAPHQMDSNASNASNSKKTMGKYIDFFTFKEKKSVDGSKPSQPKKTGQYTQPESVALKSDTKTSKPFFGIVQPIKKQKKEDNSIQDQEKQARTTTQSTARKEGSSKRSVAQIFSSLNPFDKGNTRK